MKKVNVEQKKSNFQKNVPSAPSQQRARCLTKTAPPTLRPLSLQSPTAPRIVLENSKARKKQCRGLTRCCCPDQILQPLSSHGLHLHSSHSVPILRVYLSFSETQTQLLSLHKSKLAVEVPSTITATVFTVPHFQNQGGPTSQPLSTMKQE